MSGKEQATKSHKDKGPKNPFSLGQASCTDMSQTGTEVTGKMKTSQAIQTGKEQIDCVLDSDEVTLPPRAVGQTLAAVGQATEDRVVVTYNKNKGWEECVITQKNKPYEYVPLQDRMQAQGSSKSTREHVVPQTQTASSPEDVEQSATQEAKIQEPHRKGTHKLNKRQIEEIAEQVCAGKREPSHYHIPNARDLENAHEEDLDILEQAIAEKRLQIQAEQEMEHAKAKAKLAQKIEQLEHSRLTQQHNFRSTFYKMQQKLEALSRQYENSLQDHEKELERVATQEKTLTQSILNRIASVRAEREKMGPELGRLDGALEIALAPDQDTDQARIERGILMNMQRKVQDATQNYANDEQQLHDISMEEMDMMMDELTQLEGELAEERQLSEEARAAHATRINELKNQIAKGSKGPLNIDEEKKKLQEEVDGLKAHWQTLRGHIEEHLEHTIEKTEKKKMEGRGKLMKQRADLFMERHEMGETLAEATAKVYEQEKQIDIAKQFFEDRVKIKTKELNDQEDWHAERMQERTTRRDKRIKELDNKEKERAKRRALEIQLLSGKQKKMVETFNVKKSHLEDAIKEAGERIREAEEELHEPTQEDSEKIAGLQCGISEIAQKRTFLAEEKGLMKSIAKKEIEQIQTDGKGIKSNYMDQLSTKQKELTALKHAKEKQNKQNEKKITGLEQKFGKQIDSMSKDNDKLEEYIENLSQENQRLQRERDMLKQEYADQQTGIRNAIKADQKHVEIERNKVHEELAAIRERHELAIDNTTDKIVDARAYRHDMLQDFRKEANAFAAKAVAMGPSGSGSPEARATMLTTYQAQIQEYIKRVQAIDEKLKSLMNDYSKKTDAKSKEKREALSKLQKENSNLEKELEQKQKLVKEGNRLLQLFINDDHCMYCKEKDPSKKHMDHLSWIQEENRRLTDKLTNLFKKEKEYERVSAKQVEELKTTFQKLDKKFRPRSRTSSQSSRASNSSSKTSK